MYRRFIDLLITKSTKLQKLRRYLDFFFFCKCLLPMSEGDLKIIKTRMFAHCRRLTIMIHGPKCFSSSKIAQEQKAMAKVMISISSLLTVKRKLRPSPLTTSWTTFFRVAEIFLTTRLDLRGVIFSWITHHSPPVSGIYTVGLLRTTTATGSKTTLSSISQIFNIAWTWWTGSCISIRRNSQQCCWQTVQTHTLLVGSSC